MEYKKTVYKIGIAVVLIGGLFLISSLNRDKEETVTEMSSTASTTKESEYVILGLPAELVDGNVKTEGALNSTSEAITDYFDSEEGKGINKLISVNIATTSYSVFLGFAVNVGTSSADLMTREVREAVIGYEWEALSESQLFASVVLPEWDTTKEGEDTEYKVEAWDSEKSEYILVGQFPSLEEVDFPRDGLIGPSRFKVTGINSNLLICPGDRSFNWDIRFTFGGQLGLVRTPITQKLSFWQKCEMR